MKDDKSGGDKPEKKTPPPKPGSTFSKLNK